MRGLIACISTTFADLPVHCLRHQVAGSWHFYLSEPMTTRSKCGHQSPDRVYSQPEVSAADYPSTVSMTLEDPSTVRASGGLGSWTMVYDEGFEVRVGGRKYLAFNMFDSSKQANGDIDKYVSDCSRTQVGWYKDEEAGTWGCFVASKRDLKAEPDSPKVDVALPISSELDQWKSQKRFDGDQALQQMKAALASNDMFLQVADKVVPEQTHRAHVEAINAKQGDWKAKVYPQLLNKTHAELNRFAGIPRAGQPPKPQRSFLQMAAHESRALGKIRSMPTDFDWRNKDGKNFVTAPMNQGSCGSCYAVASVAMMTARRRILENNPDAEAFSTEFPLACSEYNQGCDGGYPELIAKWSQDVGLVPESCAHYDQGSTCQLSCKLDRGNLYKVSDYGYVGGFYGATKEASMMEEVLKRGPVAVAIEPSDDFMYYQSGIYSHAATLFQEWAKVDHAVMVTGWGEEQGKKYWRVQNSWGSDWGENGTFRIRRGVDESAIEAQAIYATVEKSDDTKGFGLYL